MMSWDDLILEAVDFTSTLQLKKYCPKCRRRFPLHEKECPGCRSALAIPHRHHRSGWGREGGGRGRGAGAPDRRQVPVLTRPSGRRLRLGLPREARVPRQAVRHQDPAIAALGPTPFRDRFHEEALKLSRLEDETIVKVFDFGEWEDFQYMVT